MVVRPMTLSDSREVASLSNQLGYPSSVSDIEKRLGTMTQGADSVPLWQRRRTDESWGGYMCMLSGYWKQTRTQRSAA